MSLISFSILCNNYFGEILLSTEEKSYIEPKLITLYSFHAQLIKELIRLNYSITNICFREIDSSIFWNGIPRSDIYVPIKGIGITDYKQLLLVIEFSLPNLPEMNNLSQTRCLKIEFQE